MPEQSPLLFVPLGANPARLFGLDATERACRIARKAGMDCSDSVHPGRAAILADMGFAWDPAWLPWLARRPGTLLTLGGRPVMAHVAAGEAAGPVFESMRSGTEAGFEQLDTVPAESAELSYDELRKRERPFALPLTRDNAIEVERAAYDAAYKGVTDALTLYLWRKPAFHLTRWAAQAGLTPNLVTAIGAVLCVLAFWFFWNGDYWLGVVSGFIFMVLDTVDGKLARCTGTSSTWGNIFDHGIDLIHPPFWWWAWAHGLSSYGRALEPVYEAMLIAALVIGYIAQRAIEGIFMRRFGMHIHVWRPVDSQFRLITARRNPNMVILVASLIFARPDVGLELIALWTIVSLIFHAVRLVQANALRDRGGAVVSWLG